MQWFVTLLVVLLLRPAYAEGEPATAVCGQDRVLEAVRQRLSHAGEPAAIEPGSADQVPGGRPGVINCAVRLHKAIYDTPRLGPVPADEVQVYQYKLELRRNGIFLLP